MVSRFIDCHTNVDCFIITSDGAVSPNFSEAIYSLERHLSNKMLWSRFQCWETVAYPVFCFIGGTHWTINYGTRNGNKNEIRINRNLFSENMISSKEFNSISQFRSKENGRLSLFLYNFCVFWKWAGYFWKIRLYNFVNV